MFQVPDGQRYIPNSQQTRKKTIITMRQTTRIQWKVHPRKLTWNLKMNPWKRKFLWTTIILRFHVSFRGCMPPCCHMLHPFRPRGTKIQVKAMILAGCEQVYILEEWIASDTVVQWLVDVGWLVGWLVVCRCFKGVTLWTCTSSFWTNGEFLKKRGNLPKNGWLAISWLIPNHYHYEKTDGCFHLFLHTNTCCLR